MTEFLGTNDTGLHSDLDVLDVNCLNYLNQLSYLWHLLVVSKA